MSLPEPFQLGRVLANGAAVFGGQVAQLARILAYVVEPPHAVRILEQFQAVPFHALIGSQPRCEVVVRLGLGDDLEGFHRRLDQFADDSGSVFGLEWREQTAAQIGVGKVRSRRIEHGGEHVPRTDRGRLAAGLHSSGPANQQRHVDQRVVQ